MLEEEEEEVSDSGTLTPGRGDKMEVDEPKAPADPTLPKSAPASVEALPKGSPLKSRSPGQDDDSGTAAKDSDKPAEMKRAARAQPAWMTEQAALLLRVLDPVCSPTLDSVAPCTSP